MLMFPFDFGHFGKPSHLECLVEEDRGQYKYRLDTTVAVDLLSGKDPSEPPEAVHSPCTNILILLREAIHTKQE